MSQLISPGMLIHKVLTLLPVPHLPPTPTPTPQISLIEKHRHSSVALQKKKKKKEVKEEKQEEANFHLLCGGHGSLEDS